MGILMLTAIVFYALILLALIFKASAPVWVVIAVAIVLLYPLMYIGIGLHLAAPVLLEFHTRRIGVFCVHRPGVQADAPQVHVCHSLCHCPLCHLDARSPVWRHRCPL